MTIWHLIWVDVVRYRARFLLNTATIMIAFMLFTAIAAINNALSNSVSQASELRLMVRHKISLTRALPTSYQAQLQTLDGVNKVTFASWFGGFYQDETQQVAAIAVQADSYFNLFPEYQMPAQQRIAWQKNRIGLAVSEQTAAQYGWQLGDKVELSSALWMNKQGVFNWEFEIAAIYHGANANTNNHNLFFHHQYFDENRVYGQYQVGWYSVLANNTNSAKQLLTRIDQTFAHDQEATQTSTEQAFMQQRAQQFIDVANLLKIMTVCVFTTLLLIVGNTMMQSIRQRKGELAILKTLGFHQLTLTWMIYLEAWLSIFIGAVIGIVLSTLLLNPLQQLLIEFLPGLTLSYRDYSLQLLVVFITAILVSVVPCYALNKQTIVQAIGDN